MSSGFSLCQFLSSNTPSFWCSGVSSAMKIKAGPQQWGQVLRFAQGTADNVVSAVKGRRCPRQVHADDLPQWLHVVVAGHESRWFPKRLKLHGLKYIAWVYHYLLAQTPVSSASSKSRDSNSPGNGGLDDTRCGRGLQFAYLSCNTRRNIPPQRHSAKHVSPGCIAEGSAASLGANQ